MSSYTSTLTPREYATIPAALAIKIGLEDRDYAALFCTDSLSQHWTRVGSDLSYLKMLISTYGDSVIPNPAGGLDIAKKFPQVRAGWPDDWV